MAFTLNIYGLLSKKQNILYHGHIISVKSMAKFQKPPSVTGHRKTSRKKGKMKKICILQLLTDYITGDMIFVTCEMPFSLNAFPKCPIHRRTSCNFFQIEFYTSLLCSKNNSKYYMHVSFSLRNAS